MEGEGKRGRGGEGGEGGADDEVDDAENGDDDEDAEVGVSAVSGAVQMWVQVQTHVQPQRSMQVSVQTRSRRAGKRALATPAMRMPMVLLEPKAMRTRPTVLPKTLKASLYARNVLLKSP